MASTEQGGMDVDDHEHQAAVWPKPPAYHFPPAGPSREGPKLLSDIKAGLPRQERQGGQEARSSTQRFWRSAKWSPDGTHLLCQAEDHVVDLFRLDVDVDGGDGAYKLRPSLSVPLPSPILDATWYPMARYDDPQTWCFAVSARDVPIRLVDAYSGSTRASYIIIDHTERFVGPHALAFSPDGQCLYAAHAHMLSIFNVSIPADGPQQLQIIPSRRAPRGTNPGQKGLLSSLAVCSAQDDGNSAPADLVALGTFAGTVGLYRIPHHSPAAKLEIASTLVSGWREPDSAAVMQIAFHPTAPWLLFVGIRGRQSVTTYDTRYVGEECNFRRPAPSAARVGLFERSEDERGNIGGGRTQQKLRFDVDWGGRFLVGGDSDGVVRAWDVRVAGASFEDGEGGENLTAFGNAEVGSLLCAGAWRAGEDGVSAAALHPLLPLCATTTGSRHWEDKASSDDEDERQEPKPHDAALRLWDLTSPNEADESPKP